MKSFFTYFLLRHYNFDATNNFIPKKFVIFGNKNILPF